MGNIAVLRMVTAEGNHNKVYIMRQKNNRQFIAEYGREGAKLTKKEYSMDKWDTLYEQKVRKGYEDVTRYHQTTLATTKASEYKTIPDEVVRKLVDDILYYSNQVIKKEYKVSYENVTPEMIDDAEEIIQTLLKRYAGQSTVDDYYELEYIKRKLLDLWMIIPRRMPNVSNALYSPQQNFHEYLQNEADILDVMRGRVNTTKTKSKVNEDGKTILEAYGIDLIPITKESTNRRLKKHLDDYTAERYQDAFRIHNFKAEERFYAFMKDNGYTDEHIHWLYHGSANQNMFGLLTKSYLINSGALRTGSMFGNGIYTADLARKSLGYSSLPEGYWNGRGGRSTYQNGFIILNKVLYKNPRHIYTYNGSCSRINASNIAPHDAVFAHKGSSIINNEYVVFNEAQILMHTLIRLQHK